ncbi:unnamed protein product [Hermetia illucens]|uniref:Glutaminyl-peptide cyclotransferase n=1 Tax=Hermetia illucens TaxID=343691 RepID=A0A7R8UFT2_HERIL|nr:glutaminyl-peptide cyclotransferase isoform X2 [Hermetia illucens]CAD7079794.1 unnamed protein product [Hermetia illucens]
MPRWLLVISVLLLIVELTLELDDKVNEKWINHEASEIPPHKLAKVARMTDMAHLKDAIKNILIPRVVGTPGHTQVREYIMKTMENLGWEVTVDKFKDTAPIVGRLTFQNIIAKLNPKAERYLMLACHYDSKFYTDFEFLGATDSAVPCAMMLNLAQVMKTELKSAAVNDKLSLMFVFFDGEEAFQDWTEKDSIYGARHLAQKWEKDGFLKKIDMMVLLDLLGGADPNFYSFFKKTESWYMLLVSIEERLAEGNFMSDYTVSVSSAASRKMTNRYFQTMSSNALIEDDHIPFLKRGLPILHVIPIPFPECWHKECDNGDLIDYETTENLNKIFRVFVLEYLNIDV